MPDSPTLTPVDLSLTYEEVVDVGDAEFGDGFVAVIGPGTGFGTVTGSIGGDDGNSDDFIDSYFFTTPEDALSVVSVTLGPTDPLSLGFLGGNIYAADGRYITSVTAFGDLFPATLFAGIGESYIIEVLDFGGGEAIPYELTLEFADAGTDDVLSGRAPIPDAANSAETTDPVSVNGNSYDFFREITGNVGDDGDPADFFGFTSLTDSTALFYLEVRGGDVNVTIVDEEGVTEVISVAASDRDTVIEVPVLTDGTYFLGIAPVDAASVDYSLDVRFPGPEDGPQDFVDDINVFDAPSTPVEVPLLILDTEPVFITGSVTDADEGDVFAFVVTDDVAASIEVRSPSGQVYGTLYDANEDGLRLLQPLNGTSYGGVIIDVIPGETYFVELYGAIGDDSYQVTLTSGDAHVAPEGTEDEVSLPGGASLWSDDVGGTLGTSSLIPLDGNGNLTAQGSLGVVDEFGTTDEADVYRFVATVSGTADFSIQSDTGVNGFMTLYDATGTPFSGSEGGGTFSEVLVAGKVYALEIPYGSGGADDYTLTIDAPAAAAFEERSNGLGLGDAGASQANALDLTLSDAGDSVIRGSVGIGADGTDVFRFVPVVSGTADIFLGDDFQVGLTATFLDVTEGSSVESFSVPFFSGAQIGPVAVEAGREYLVTVEPDVPVPALYTLTINTPSALAAVDRDDVVDGLAIGDAPSDLDSSHALDLASQDKFIIEGSLTGFAGATADVLDNFSFVAPEDGTITITVQDVVGDLGSTLTLGVFDSVSGTPTFIGGFATQGVNRAIRPVTQEVEAGKEYFVTTTSLTRAVNYTLVIDADPDAIAEGLEMELPTSPVLASLDLSVSFVEDADIGDQFGPDYLTIGPGTGIGEVSGFVGELSEFGIADTDTLLFTSPNDALSVITLTLNGEALSGDDYLFARLRSGNDRFVADFSNPGTSVELFAGIGETYYVEVIGGDSALAYTLTMEIRDAGTDDFEANQYSNGDLTNLAVQTVPSAVSVSYFESFSSFSGNVGAGDDSADFFAFESLADSSAQLLLKVRGGDATVTLIDAAGSSEMLPVSDGSDTVFDIPVAVNDVRTFGIAASGEGSVDYSWELAIPGPDDGPLDMVDGTLVFDAPFTAIEAPLVDFSASPSRLDGSVSPLDWRDSYALTTPDSNSVVIDFNSFSGTVSVEVLNASRDFFKVITALPGTTYGGLAYDFPTAEPYFLEINSLSSAIEPYAINVVAGPEHVAPAGSEDQVTLPGDEIYFSSDAGGSLGRSTLTPLDGGGDLTVEGTIGHSDDSLITDMADVFRFVATANGMTEISLDSDSVAVDDEFFPVADSVAVFDAAGNEIAFASNVGGSALLFADLKVGEVYAVIVNGNADAGAYSLFVDAPAPVAFEERVGYRKLGDAGADIESAVALDLSSAGDAVVEGSTGFGDDLTDAFVITPAASGELYLLLTDDYQTPLVLRVTDPLSGDFSTNSPFTLNGRLTHQVSMAVVAGQDYLVSVESEAPLPSRYTLTVNAPTEALPAAGTEAVDGVSIGEATADLANPDTVTLAFTGDATVTGSLAGEVGDETDTFSFVAPASGKAIITPRDLVTDGQTSVSVAIYSVDAQDQPVNEYVLYPGPNSPIEPLKLDVAEGAEYIIAVRSDFSEASYTLDIDTPGGILDFITLDRFDDGLLYDADFLLDSGVLISAEDAQLYRTYGGALGRVPDVGGFDWWSEQISLGNHDLDSMVAGFIFSDEFLGFFDNVTHPIDISSADFVSHMYENVFGRAPDEGGFNFWTGVLDSGQLSQARVVVEMTQSNEFIGLNANGMIDFLI